MKRFWICIWTIISLFFVACGKDESRSGHVQVRIFSENGYYGNARIKNVQIETVNGWKNILPTSSKDNPMAVTVHEGGFGIRWTYDNVSYDTSTETFSGDRIEYYESRLTATTSKKDFAILESTNLNENIIRRYDYYSGNLHDYDTYWSVKAENTNLKRSDFSIVKVNYDDTSNWSPVELDVAYLVKINKSNIDTPQSEEPEFYYTISGGNRDKWFEVINQEILNRNPKGISKGMKFRYKVGSTVKELDFEKDFNLEPGKRYTITIKTDGTTEITESK